MKHVRQFKGSWVIAIVVISLAMASCYQFARIFAPKEVAGNTPYEGRIVCVNENNNGEQTGYSVFAVRVPRNWDVTVGDSAYQQYAREGLKNSLGEDVNMAAPMVYSHVLSELYNESNPLEGYEWLAFRTEHVNRRSIQGSNDGGCDSICFNFTVLNDGVAGTYVLDYIIGSIESNDDDPSVIDNYAGRLADAQGSDLFRVSTEQVKVKPSDNEFNKVMPEFKTTVVVLEGGTPVTHDPSLTLSASAISTDGTVTINYANLPKGASVEIYKQAALVAMQESFAVEGESRHNSGSFETDTFEPGCYHVRALRSNGTLVDGCAEVVFTVSGYADLALACDKKVMVISEPAILTPDNVGGKAYEASRGLTASLFLESYDIVKAIVDSALAYRPAALLVAGGLTKNGEEEGHKLLASELGRLTEAGIKVCVVPGEQDIDNPEACRFQGETSEPVASVNAELFANIYAGCGYGDAVSKDEGSLSYLAYLTDDLAVLALDSHEGFLTPQTVAWMKQAAATAHSTGRHVVALMHHLVGAPYDGYDRLGTLVNKPEDTGLIASILGDSTAVAEPVVYDLSTADIQDALVVCGISTVFTGDLAASDIACIYTSDDTPLWQVNTGGATSFDCPWRLVGIKDDGLVVETHLTTNLPDKEGMSFEDYAYYRTKYRLSEFVDSFCVQNWPLINGFLQKNFVFEVSEDDLFNKNDFFVLPSEPQQMSAIINNSIVPPMSKLLITLADGNENLKKAQQLLDEFHAGVDGILNGLNTLPAIITPMLKEGFAEAGLDLDVTVDVVVGSMVFNYVGSPDNVTNDLFVYVPFAKDDLSAIRLPKADESQEEVIYNLSGQRIPALPAQGVIIYNGKKIFVK
ncbi:MAG: hypothetical protein IK000_03760 [Bacteroidaceae bacterium]|nr:hypothetical protein [Bacteroidaceae bacterium]